MRIWMKRSGLLILALVIGTGFYVALRERPIAVDIAMVSTGPMRVTIDEEGVTRVKDVYAVSSPIMGHLDRTTLDEGHAVIANETVIASIHPLDPPFLDQRTHAELTAAVDAARSSVALAKVELHRARTAHSLALSQYNRAAKLAETRTISTSQLENSLSKTELAQAQVASMQATIGLREAELAIAEARLQQPGNVNATQTEGDCCVHIVAPIDGIILKILTRSEQAVSPGTRIAEIGDPTNLEIVVDVLSIDAARIKPGARVEITDWGGETTIEGAVDSVEPAAFTKVSSLGIEEQRVNVIVEPKTVPPRLGHGYRVLAHLKIWERDNAVQVPVSALFRSNGTWSVFEVDGGRAKLKKIEIGQMNTEFAEVLSGMNENSIVVLYPNDLLEDGSQVEERGLTR